MRNPVTHLQLVFISALIILVLFPLLSSVAGPDAHEDKLIGPWAFEKGTELKDLRVTLGRSNTRGAAQGTLKLGKKEYALATGYKGPDIDPKKTMVSWIYLDNLDLMPGGPLTIRWLADPIFDSIVYAER